MTTGWPQRAESSAPTARISTSTPPPGGNGTTMRTGLLGKPWAAAGAVPASSARPSAAPAAQKARRASEAARRIRLRMANRQAHRADVLDLDAHRVAGL